MLIRKGARLPRIIKINWIDKANLKMSVLFRNGESRILDFRKILQHHWRPKRSDPAYKLYDPEIFSSVNVGDGHGLEWRGLQIPWTDWETGKKITVAYDVGADTMYELSEPDPELNFSIGEMVKKARLAAKLTQEEVAKRAGTSRTYITKLENDKQDIEVMTLKKIVEAGLNKRLKISIR